MPREIEESEDVAPELWLFFRDKLREARAKAWGNAEDAEALIFAIESIIKTEFNDVKLGLDSYLKPDRGNLLKCNLQSIGVQVGGEYYKYITNLFKLMVEDRNDSFHTGVPARHLVNRVIELSYVFELICYKKYKEVTNMNDSGLTVGDVMVRNPVCAFPWMPIFEVRRLLLVNSFSYLPCKYNGNWYLVSDGYLCRGINIKDDLVKPLKKIIEKHGSPAQAQLVCENQMVSIYQKDMPQVPSLVMSAHNCSECIGIITPFDVLACITSFTTSSST